MDESIKLEMFGKQKRNTALHWAFCFPLSSNIFVTNRQWHEIYISNWIFWAVWSRTAICLFQIFNKKTCRTKEILFLTLKISYAIKRICFLGGPRLTLYISLIFLGNFLWKCFLIVSKLTSNFMLYYSCQNYVISLAFKRTVSVPLCPPNEYIRWCCSHPVLFMIVKELCYRC